METTSQNNVKLSQHSMKQGKPKLLVENKLHDFGRIYPGGNYTCEFKFRNIGTGLLKISKVIATCSCTAFELDQKEYAPGESGSVKVVYRAPTIDGNSSRHLYILSNDPNNPEFQLRLNADVVSSITVKPLELKIDLKKKSYGIEPIFIKSNDSNTFSIIGINSDDNIFTIDFDKKVKKTEYMLLPKLNMSTLKKEAGTINIQITHPKYKSINIPYYFIKEFSIFPQRIIFFKTNPKDKETREIVIKNNYKEPFEIDFVTSVNNYIEVIEIKEQGTSTVIKVRTNLPGELKKTRYLKDELQIKIKENVYSIPCAFWIANNEDKRTAM